MAYNLEVDEVTGAPRLIGTSRRRSWHGPPAGYYTPVVSPPLGYNYSGYIPGQFLTPSPSIHTVDLPPSPVLMPTQWHSAYTDAYGRPSPYRNHADLPPLVDPESSPRQRPVPLYESPYTHFIPLPPVQHERYDRPRDSWASRLFEYLSMERENEPHREYNAPQQQLYSTPNIFSLAGQFTQRVDLHESLIRKRSRINWTVHAPPHTIRVNNPPEPETSAFMPELTHCRIVSPLLPWAIEIKARRDERYITVFTLLADIHRALSKGIDRAFYESLPLEFREEINREFQNRCISIQDTEAANRALDRGIQRSDFLLGRVKYAGLKQIKSLMYTFELELEKPT
jgi:hypothetical protein